MERPNAVWAAPLVVLAFMLTVIAFDAGGLASVLRGALFDAYARTSYVLHRPAQALAGELIWIALFGGGAILAGLRFGALGSAVVAGAGAVGGGIVSWHLFAAEHALFDAANPALGLALVFAASAAARHAEIGAARAALRMTFAESLPSATLEKLARRPALLKLEGEVRNITFLSCGIRGFGALAASMRDHPAAFMHLMQRVLPPLMDEVLAQGGTVERLTAEGFSAYWNAPLDDPAHALHACEAASGMSVIVSRLNEFIAQEQRLDSVTLSPVEIGVGIADGPAILGGFRAHGHTSYSVNGGAPALAARVQMLSQQYGPAVIVCEQTKKGAERGFAFLEVDTVAAGEGETGEGAAGVKLYALLGNPVTRGSPKFRALQTFHEHIFQSIRTQQWRKARELIGQCRKLSGASQKLYDLHITRIAYFEKNPPPPGWDGVFRPILK